MKAIGKHTLCAGLLLLVLGGLIGTASAQPLADNEWRALNPQPSNRYVTGTWPAVDVLSNTQTTPTSRVFSGIHYGDGKIFYLGGGHSGYSGNDVEVYNIASNIWQQSYAPEWCALTDTSCNNIYGGGPVAVLTPLGRPYVEETFQKLSWNPVTQRLVADLTPGTFTYNPVTTQWTRIGDGVYGADINDWMLLPYDPDLGATLAVVSRDGFNPSGVYKLTPTGWQYLTSVPFDYHYIYGAYMPDQHAHVLYGGNDTVPPPWGFWKFDTRTLTWTNLNAPPAVVNTVDSFDYDTLHHVMIAIQHSEGAFVVWSYDPATNVWAQIPQTFATPGQTIGIGGFAPLLRYDPISNVFIFLQTTCPGCDQITPTQTWAYRYRQ